jgi:quinol monooxygenase YgiN
MRALNLLAVAAAVLVTTNIAAIRAQESRALESRAQEANAIYIVGYIEVARSARGETLHLLRAHRDASRKEDGNLAFGILQRVERSQQFAVLEIWKDAKAQASHAAAAETKAFRDKLKPLLAAPYDERSHTGFVAGRPELPGARALYVLTHVDLNSAKKDIGLGYLKQLSADSAKDAGVRHYDVLQQTNRTNHVTLFEAWRGKAALEKHETADHTRKFREELIPMSGSLYDQRLYRLIK